MRRGSTSTLTSTTIPSAGLRGGTSDVALLRLPLETRGLELTPLFSEPRVATLSTRHPLARREALTLADLHATTIVRPASPDPIWNVAAAGLRIETSAATLPANIPEICRHTFVCDPHGGWQTHHVTAGKPTT